MTTDIYSIQASFQNDASVGLAALRRDLQGADGAASSLFSSLGKTSEELGRASDGTAQYSQEIRDLARQLSVSEESLDKLLRANRNANEAYDEAGQKLLDVRKRLDEYGASAELQEDAITRLLTGVERSTLPLAKQALVLEELAIEFQDGRKALDFFDEGLRLVERRGGRVEEAIAQLTQAAKGDTAALSDLGPVARAAAEQIDKIRDPHLRAAETLRVFRQESARVPDTLDKVNDRLVQTQLGFSTLAARLGPVGILAGTVGVALLALGGGALKVATDSTEAYIESNKEAKKTLDLLKFSAQETQRELGKFVFEGARLDQTMLGLTFTLSKVRGGLDDITAGSIAARLGVTDMDAETERLGNTLLKLGISEAKDQFQDLADVALGNLPTLVTSVNQVFNEQGQIIEPLIGKLERLAKSYDQAARDADRFINSVPTLDELAADRRTRQQATSLLSTSGQLRGADPFTIGEGERVQGPLRQGGEFLTPDDQDFFAFEQRELGRGRGAGGTRQERDVLAAIERSQDAYLDELDRRARVLEALNVPDPKDSAVARGFADAGAFSPSLSTQDEIYQEQLAREAQQEVRAQRLEALLDRANLDTAEGISVEQFDLITDEGLDSFEKMIQRSEQLNASLNTLATQGIASVITGVASLAGGLVTGEVKARDFGAAFLGTFGNVLQQAGQGMVLLGLGTLNIAQGLTNPAALIAVGAGAIIAGKALSGGASSFSSRGSGGAGASSSVTQEAFREATDRILDRRDEERRSIFYVINLEGDVIQGSVERATARLTQQGIFAPGGV